MNKHQHNMRAWVVSVDMGYGHQRASYPLKDIAYKNEIVTANNYAGIPGSDMLLWKNSRKFYEFISRFKQVPIIGQKVWDLYDQLQEIPSFYPKRDLSKISLQLQQIYRLIEKKKWGKHLIEELAKSPRPFITSFFIPAFMAEEFNYPGEIFCLATDTDINRAWAPKNPATSRINYFAPSYRVIERLKLYGVPKERIFLTGFPLPLENTGTRQLEVLKKDVLYRLANLDPYKRYYHRYKEIIKLRLGSSVYPKPNHILTLMFTVGGAGAQREIGSAIVHSLKNSIIDKKIKVILVAGTHQPVIDYFTNSVVSAGLKKELGGGVQILSAKSKMDYFKQFNIALRTTDILWTKPSELSFYTALGLPIIIAPPIGSQEEFNRRWLRTIGSAANQLDPKYTHEWLFDWVDSGWFAEAAMEGFIEAPQYGTYNIERIINHRPDQTKEVKMILQY